MQTPKVRRVSRVRSPDGVPKQNRQALPVGFVFCLFIASGVRTRKGRRRPRGSPANCRAGVVFEATGREAEERRIAQRYAKPLMVRLHSYACVYIMFVSPTNLPTNMQQLSNCPLYRIVPRQVRGAHLSGENRERHITFKCDTYHFKK